MKRMLINATQPEERRLAIVDQRDRPGGCQPVASVVAHDELGQRAGRGAAGRSEGSGEEELHGRPYDFFQYKRDNAKFGNGNVLKSNSHRVSLEELARQVLKKLNEQ